MEQNKSSITSLISAFGRAYHHKYDSPKIFDDFMAGQLITQQEFSDISRNMIAGITFFNKDIAEQLQDKPEEILKWITQVQLSPTPLARAAYCENVLLHEMSLGVKQYVILGAGMDTFCFRHPELQSHLDIFEIDHPATQQFKRERLAQIHAAIPDSLHFIAADFTGKLSYSKQLDEGIGFHKTFFSLLGVTYYLAKEDLSRLLKYWFDQVPPGSSIVLDYADEGLFEEKGLYNRVENMVKMASAGGEPMKSCFALPEMTELLEEAGLLIYEHLPPGSIQRQHFGSRTDYLQAFETIHFIHAVKQ
jgi:methyltransferase (TIGR00027 family)